MVLTLYFTSIYTYTMTTTCGGNNLSFILLCENIANLTLMVIACINCMNGQVRMIVMSRENTKSSVNGHKGSFLSFFFSFFFSLSFFYSLFLCPTGKATNHCELNIAAGDID